MRVIVGGILLYCVGLAKSGIKSQSELKKKQVKDHSSNDDVPGEERVNRVQFV